MLEAYLEKPAPYTILVLLAPYEKLDERKKITKLLKKKAAVVEAKELNPKETTDFTITLVKTEGKTISAGNGRTVCHVMWWEPVLTFSRGSKAKYIYWAARGN